MISISQILYITSFSLILIGLYTVLSQHNLIRIAIGLNISEVGINLLLVTLSYLDGGQVPIFSSKPVTGPMIDPVPSALVLTAIVIGFGTTALMLTLIMRIYAKYGTIDTSKLKGLKW